MHFWKVSFMPYSGMRLWTHVLMEPNQHNLCKILIQYYLFTISDCGFPVTHTNNHEQMETRRNVISIENCIDETQP